MTLRAPKVGGTSSGREYTERRSRQDSRDGPPPRLRPHVDLPGGRRRAAASADRHRRAEPEGRDLVPIALDGRVLPGGSRYTRPFSAAELSEGMMCLAQSWASPCTTSPTVMRTGSSSSRRTASPATTIRPVIGCDDRRRVRDNPEPLRLPFRHRSRARGGRHLQQDAQAARARREGLRRRQDRTPTTSA